MRAARDSHIAATDPGMGLEMILPILRHAQIELRDEAVPPQPSISCDSLDETIGPPRHATRPGSDRPGNARDDLTRRPGERRRADWGHVGLKSGEEFSCRQSCHADAGPGELEDGSGKIFPLARGELQNVVQLGTHSDDWHGRLTRLRHPD